MTTVDAFNAHMAEVHIGEGVAEAASAEGEGQLEEVGGVLDKEMGLAEEVADPPLDSNYLMEEVVGGDTGMIVEEIPDNGTTEVFGPLSDGNQNLVDESESSYVCGICQNGFANEILLEEHNREHPTCPICFSKLLSRAHYKDHVDEHPNCAHCGIKVVGNVELENHLLFEHVIGNTQQTTEESSEKEVSLKITNPFSMEGCTLYFYPPTIKMSFFIKTIVLG